MLGGENSQCQSVETGKLGAESTECSAFLGAAGEGGKARRATADQHLNDLDAGVLRERSPNVYIILSVFLPKQILVAS